MNTADSITRKDMDLTAPSRAQETTWKSVSGKVRLLVAQVASGWGIARAISPEDSTSSGQIGVCLCDMEYAHVSEIPLADNPGIAVFALMKLRTEKIDTGGFLDGWYPEQFEKLDLAVYYDQHPELGLVVYSIPEIQFRKTPGVRHVPFRGCRGFFHILTSDDERRPITVVADAETGHVVSCLKS